MLDWELNFNMIENPTKLKVTQMKKSQSKIDEDGDDPDLLFEQIKSSIQKNITSKKEANKALKKEIKQLKSDIKSIQIDQGEESYHSNEKSDSSFENSSGESEDDWKASENRLKQLLRDEMEEIQDKGNESFGQKFITEQNPNSQRNTEQSVKKIGKSENLNSSKVKGKPKEGKQKLNKNNSDSRISQESLILDMRKVLKQQARKQRGSISASRSNEQKSIISQQNIDPKNLKERVEKERKSSISKKINSSKQEIIIPSKISKSKVKENKDPNSQVQKQIKKRRSSINSQQKRETTKESIKRIQHNAQKKPKQKCDNSIRFRASPIKPETKQKSSPNKGLSPSTAKFQSFERNSKAWLSSEAFLPQSNSEFPQYYLEQNQEDQFLVPNSREQVSQPSFQSNPSQQNSQKQKKKICYECQSLLRRGLSTMHCSNHRANCNNAPPIKTLPW